MSQAVSASPALPLEWRPRASPWLIAAAVMSATFMEVLDTTVVTVSLPHIAGNLSVSTDEATWVLTSYLVANAVVLPATGWFSSRFGRKKFLISCIIIFTIASGLCGAAVTLPMLILSRILQGAAGGALQPISQAVLLESFPPHKRGMAMAVFGLGIVVAPIVGPTLGGWITDNYNWRWIFYINLPVGVLAIMMVKAFIEDPPYIRRNKDARVDYFGFALLATWIGCFQVVLDKGQQEDWLGSSFIRALLIVAVIALIAFIVRELKARDPLVNLRVLANRNFAVGTALMTLLGAVLYGATALLPLFLQTLLGYPAVESGLAVSPRGFGSITGMLIIGRLVGIIDSRVLIAVGFAILAYSTRLLGGLDLMIAPNNVVWPNIINGFATALIFVPLTTSTMGTLRNEQMGNATGIFNLMRNLGGGVGIAMVTTLLARGAQTHQNNLVGHMTPYDAAYVQHEQAVTAGLTPQVGSYAAAQQAHAILYGQLQQQANLAAYMDDFRLLSGLCLLCIPAVLALSRGRAKPPPGAVH